MQTSGSTRLLSHLHGSVQGQAAAGQISATPDSNTSHNTEPGRRAAIVIHNPTQGAGKTIREVPHPDWVSRGWLVYTSNLGTDGPSISVGAGLSRPRAA